jgi:hypothetical protein
VRIGLVILEELTPMLQDVLEYHIPRSQISSEVTTQIKKQRRQDKQFLKFGAEQMLTINNAHTDGYRNFDITLLYTLLRNLKCLNITAPTQGWGTSNMPGNGETTLGDDIERIRLIRNNIWGHVAVPSLSEKESQDLWSIISGVCSRMQKVLGKNYVKRLHDAEIRPITEEMENKQIKITRKLIGNFST